MSSELIVVGLSHHTAPLAMRERLAVPGERLGDELQRLASLAELSEALLVSTCNRVELYGVSQTPLESMPALRDYLGTRGMPDDLGPMLYERLGRDATRHAFRVAASLDSMVVGEPQILGQVKHAYATAEACGTIGMLLARCFHRAFAVAKRVRTETRIASGSVSISSIAIELARKIFGDLGRRHTLLLGAGKMGEAAAKHLAKQGAILTVINRSPERAIEVARACGGEPRDYDQLAQSLIEADVVITSTSSPRFVITSDLMADVVRARKHRPLFLIDIAVPRDIDPRVGNMDNIFLYDVDDLQKVAAENLAQRRLEASAAERIVEHEVESFEQWRRTLDLTPTIVALRTRFHAVVRSELERTMPRLGNLEERERKSLEAMAESIVNKLLHQPVALLKREQGEADAGALIAATRRLFDLGEDGAELRGEAPSSPPAPVRPPARGNIFEPVTGTASRHREPK